MTKIKICGITGEDEIAALNETGVDYAGFVLYEKSKRYVTVQKARQLFEKLNKGIRKAAVTVAPERALIEDIGRAGFDLLQVHGVDAAEAERIAAQTKLPVWLAVNLRDPAEVRRWRREEYHRIAGVVIDAGAYGSGRHSAGNRTDRMRCAVPCVRSGRNCWQRGVLLCWQADLTQRMWRRESESLPPMSQMSAAAWKRCATEREQKV